MERAMIVTLFGLVLFGGIYLAKDNLMSIASVVIAANEAVSPEEKTPAVVSSSQPATASEMSARFRDKLLIMDGGVPRAFDSSKMDGVKYLAYYYSAGWCPPCRAFTPDLIAFYNGFKPAHPEFELIFVSQDKSDPDMINYMTGEGMPWPAVWYTSIADRTLNAEKYASRGIPDLVLVDSRGRVLSDSSSWFGYRDPHEVIDDIRSMVK